MTMKTQIVQDLLTLTHRSDIVAIYGSGVYGTATYGGQSEPLLRQSVEGSGFTVAVRVDDNGKTAPYALGGFQMEYQQELEDKWEQHTRQSTYSDGDVITSAHTNDEFNQLSRLSFLNRTHTRWDFSRGWSYN